MGRRQRLSLTPLRLNHLLVLDLASGKSLPSPLSQSGSEFAKALASLPTDADHIVWIPSRQASRPYGVRLSRIVSFHDPDEQTQLDTALANTGAVGSELQMSNGRVIRLFMSIDDLKGRLDGAGDAANWGEVFVHGQTENRGGAIRFNTRLVEMAWQWGRAV